jgi:hypothetical protein
LAIFIVPVLYAIIQGLVEARHKRAPGIEPLTEPAQ